MSEAFQCDLCTRLQAGKARVRMSIINMDEPSSPAKDMCDDCSSQFKQWLSQRLPMTQENAQQ